MDYAAMLRDYRSSRIDRSVDGLPIERDRSVGYPQGFCPASLKTETPERHAPVSERSPISTQLRPRGEVFQKRAPYLSLIAAVSRDTPKSDLRASL
jgi:hypothetical protein